MAGPKRRERRIDRPLLGRGGSLADVVGPFGAHDVVPDAHRVVILRRTAHAEVIVVRADRDVLASQAWIAPRQHRHDVARECGGGGDGEPHVDGRRGARGAGREPGEWA